MKTKTTNKKAINIMQNISMKFSLLLKSCWK